jgi:hypothetical protein
MELEGREEFCRLIEALRPSLDTLIIAGGWAHRLHRLSPHARTLNHPPLATEDVDVVIDRDHTGKAPDLKATLRAAGFTEDFSGDARPPITYYQLGEDNAGFYAEFLTPLRGGTHRRDGTPDDTAKIQGVNAQKLRHLELLMIAPWVVEISAQTGFPIATPTRVLVPNPVCFMVQKLLVHFDRKPDKRPGDLLYIYDTIETFSASLDELAVLCKTHVAPSMSKRTATNLAETTERLFGSLNDMVRNAARIAPLRNLDPETMRRICKAGLDQILTQ